MVSFKLLPLLPWRFSLTLGKFKLIQNNGIAKQINCNSCKSVDKEVYDNVYTLMVQELKYPYIQGLKLLI